MLYLYFAGFFYFLGLVQGWEADEDQTFASIAAQFTLAAFWPIVIIWCAMFDNK